MKNAAIASLVFVGIALAGCSAPPQQSVSQPGGTPLCTYVPAGVAAKPAKLPPTTGVATTGAVDYVLTINGAQIGVQLDRAAAPCTVNSFVSLASQGYFDNTTCHRLGDVPGSFQMLQCGDPTALGSGGPGYRFDDELTGKETYPSGTLAMANSGPDTNGSQFFLVFGDTGLKPDYTVFGKIDAAGVKTLATIAAVGTDNTGGEGVGHPLKPVNLTSVKPR